MSQSTRNHPADRGLVMLAAWVRPELRDYVRAMREACAEAVKRFWGVGDYSAEVQACRATPLVTEVDK